jgi:glycosyltransferase involved in cell wall biosynthesis
MGGEVEIAVEIFAHLPSRRAHTHQAMQMCEAFAHQGARVTLLVGSISAGNDDSQLCQQYDVEPIFAIQSLHVPDVMGWIDQKGRSVPKPFKILLWRLMLLYFSLKFIRWAGRHPGVMIYARDALACWLASLSSRGSGKRCYLEVHACPAGKVNLWLHRLLADRIGGFVVITRHLQERLHGRGIRPRKILIAHDGVRLQRFGGAGAQGEVRSELGWSQDSVIIGYAGTLGTTSQKRGVPVLIKAIRELRERCPNRRIQLALIGCSPDTAQVLARQFGDPEIESGLIAPGWVHPRDLPRYMAAFDMCVQPLPWTEGFAYDASPLKLFEYMASGTPVLSTNLPSLREILRDGSNAILVRPNDARSMADGMVRLLQQPELAKSIAAQAQHDVREYSWRSRAERIMAFIDMV